MSVTLVSHIVLSNFFTCRISYCPTYILLHRISPHDLREQDIQDIPVFSKTSGILIENSKSLTMGSECTRFLISTTTGINTNKSLPPCKQDVKLNYYHC